MKEDIFKALSGKGRWSIAVPLVGASIWSLGSELPWLAKVIISGCCVGACLRLFR